MSLVYAGVLSHAPGITGRADLVKNVARRDEFYRMLDRQREQIEASGAEALVVMAAVYETLDVGAVTLRVNDRRILNGMLEQLDAAQLAA